ncbi:hypothetical protein GCM10009804_62420 [Kribbella hippodromi]|uniref:Uncharacterized protein n=1 Tax=Kribbella hippodromi TaxID=434347 RepID=A0ABP4Q0V2_9ACTN
MNDSTRLAIIGPAVKIRNPITQGEMNSHPARPSRRASGLRFGRPRFAPDVPPADRPGAGSTRCCCAVAGAEPDALVEVIVSPG